MPNPNDAENHARNPRQVVFDIMLPVVSNHPIRTILDKIADRIELDDPNKGMLATISVTGGVLLHPRSKVAVKYLQVYAAGQNNVKIIQPKFLRSLPIISIDGIEHPSQFCAHVARKMGELLNGLKTVYTSLKNMGIHLNLDEDTLMLTGYIQVGQTHFKLIANQTGRLTITDCNQSALAGRMPPNKRSMTLQSDVQTDRQKIQNLFAYVYSMSSTPGSQPSSPSPADNQDSSDVVELTEIIENRQGACTPARVEKNTGMAPFKIIQLLDKLGSGAEISAVDNRLKLIVPLKVIQGRYVFSLEQIDQSRFQGFLHSPNGVRYKVLLDMNNISDIKEIFDNIMLKNSDQ